MSKIALIAVDVQADFIRSVDFFVMPKIEELYKRKGKLRRDPDIIIASQSVHPPNHFSFPELGAHCVKGTYGARIDSNLKEEADYIVTKGDEQGPPDSYGAFYARTLRPIEWVSDILEVHKIDTIWVAGLGHSWDVPQTAYDANALGYATIVWRAAVWPRLEFSTREHMEKIGITIR